MPLVEVIDDAGSGDVKHDRTGQVAPPTFPYHARRHARRPTRPRREQLANWITSKDNQYFAKSYVNRLWGYLFGVGIIEPIDDIRAGNPPTNPELLDRLTKEFIDERLRRAAHAPDDLQVPHVSALGRRPTSGTRTTTSTTRTPSPAGCRPRCCSTRSTARPARRRKLPGVPPGSRAAQLPDGSVDLPSGFLDDFGKPVRESACECERSSGMVLGPILKLVNGPTVADALRDPNNRLNKLAVADKDDRQARRGDLPRRPEPPADGAKEMEIGLKAAQGGRAGPRGPEPPITKPR